MKAEDFNIYCNRDPAIAIWDIYEKDMNGNWEQTKTFRTEEAAKNYVNDKCKETKS